MAVSSVTLDVPARDAALVALWRLSLLLSTARDRPDHLHVGVRAANLSKSFGKLKLSNFEVGATLLVIGLFKKVVIADNLGRMVDPAFAAMQGGSTLIAPQAWAGALAYYPQLYFDFSGYADMALGIGRLFGLRLPINFDSPLRASGIVDFYRRWHITLTRVIARFLFTPLSLWGLGSPCAGRQRTAA